MKKLRKFFIGLIVAIVISLITPVLYGTTVEAKDKKLRLNYSWVNVSVGGSIKLKVKGTSKKVKWKSSNKKIATVGKKGKITGKKIGRCTVTAKVKNHRVKCKVRVKKLGKKTYKFTSAALTLSTLKLNVKDIDYNNEGNPVMSDRNGTFKLTALNYSKSVLWKTSNSAVAVVDNGLITAVAEGKCNIIAVIDGKSYICSVIVTNSHNPQQVDEQKVIYEMTGYINEARVKAKATPLKIKEELNAVAHKRVKEISSEKKNFSHTRPNGLTYRSAYNEAGIKKYLYTGENLAYILDRISNMQVMTKMAFDNLYNSSSHRAIIENPEYEYIGIGYKNAGGYKLDGKTVGVEAYWVQEFYA